WCCCVCYRHCLCGRCSASSASELESAMLKRNVRQRVPATDADDFLLAQATPRGSLRALSIALRPLLAFAWRVLLVLTVSRVLLIAWQWQRVSDAGTLDFLLLQGLRFDLVLLGLALVVPVVLFPLL